jgi:hypothetical protein
MKASQISFATILILSSNVCYTWAGCSRQTSRPLKTFIIDLDKPAHEHFAEPVAYFKEEIAALVEAEK